MSWRRAETIRRLALGGALLLAVGCSDEDRKAWVSILPGSEDEEVEAEPDAPPAPPGPAVSADSTALLLSGDTLVAAERLPDRGPGGVDLRDARFLDLAISPDSLHVAFTAEGEAPVVGIWTRARQSARFVTARPDAQVDRLEWSSDGRFLVWQATGPGGVTTVGAYDLRVGASTRHPVLSWLERRGRSAWIQDWISDARIRLLVAPGAEREGGLAWMWQLHGGSLVVEDQVEPLARNAPPESQLLAGGAFSLDALGDPVPESFALYVSSEMEPSALVIRNRAGEYAATITEPLVDPAILEITSWEGIRRGAELEEVVEVGGRPVLLLSVPVPGNPVQTLGFFEVTPAGRVEAIQARGPEGTTPALFPDGRTADRIFDLGLVDLDEDGQVEVVAAIGRQDPDALRPRLQWGAQVWQWSEGARLVPAPALEEAAIETLETLTGTAAAP